MIALGSRIILLRRFIGVAAICWFALAGYEEAFGQNTGTTSVSVFVGGSEYDLSGVGWTVVFGPRVDYRFLGPLTVQLAVPLYSYEPQFNQRVTYVLPELSFLVSPRIGPVFPYLAFGSGWSLVAGGPRGIDGLTLHAAAGFRLQVVKHWDIRSELRARAIDPWGASTADISGGLGYRF